MGINLFLSEHYNKELIKQIPDDDINIVINGIFLTKIQHDKNFKSIFDNFDIQELNKIYIFKNEINYDQIKNYYGVNKSLDNSLHKYTFFSLNRLFFHHNFSSIDANFFIDKNKDVLANNKITVYIGENYRLTETFTILYWLMLINKISKNIKIIWLCRSKNQIHYDNFFSFYNEKIFTNSNEFKIIKSNKKFENYKSLLWINALRDREYWVHKTQALNIAQTFDHLDHGILFNISNKINSQFQKRFFDFDKNIIKNNNFEVCFKNNPVIEFYNFFVLPVLQDIFKKGEEQLLKIININEIKHFYACSAPLIESILIHNLVLKNNIQTTLLPHSFTPAHQYHPESYKVQYCKIKSEPFMPSANWKKLSNKKEDILKQIESVNISNKITFKKIKLFLYKNYQKIFSIYYLEKFFKNFFYIFEFIYQKNYLLNKLKNPNENFIIFLNVEIYEMLTIQDFNNLNNVLSKIFSICKKNKINFLIRRKPNWTNFYLLKKKISKYNDFKNLYLLNDKFSIKEICKLCNFVLFTQGTSAMLEVMRYNKPVFIFKDQSIMEMNEPYIKFDNNLVPEISFDQLELLNDKKYLDEIRHKQQYFYAKQIS